MESNAFLKVVKKRADQVGADQFAHEERLIRDLVEHAGWKVVQELVADQEQRLLSEILPQGAGDVVPSHAAYVRVTGQIGGLRHFAQIADTVFQEAERRRRAAAESSAGAGGKE